MAALSDSKQQPHGLLPGENLCYGSLTGVSGLEAESGEGHNFVHVVTPHVQGRLLVASIPTLLLMSEEPRSIEGLRETSEGRKGRVQLNSVDSHIFTL